VLPASCGARLEPVTHVAPASRNKILTVSTCLREERDLTVQSSCVRASRNDKVLPITIYTDEYGNLTRSSSTVNISLWDAGNRFLVRVGRSGRLN
jgi:hypothetical protein